VRSRQGLLSHGLKLAALASLAVRVGFVSAAAHADDAAKKSNELGTIIVTGSQLPSDTKTTGSSVTVIGEQEIEDGQYRNALGALQQVPGLDIVQSGGFGGNAAVFLRGGNSEGTLVLLDGIELNNPATPNRSYNMANLTLENIERVEVIRGPQSTIYGSDAMGGVINLVSKKAQEGVHSTVTSEAGSYNSFTQVGNLSYGSKGFDVSTGITRQDIGGISAANAADGNSEHDGYENTSLTNRMRFAPTDSVEGSVTTRYDHSNTSLDNMGGVGGDDLNRRFRNNEFFTRGDMSVGLLDKTLTPAAYISYSRHSLKDVNSPDAVSSEVLDSSFGGDIVTVGSRATWKPSEVFSSVVGGETQGERADSYYFSDGAFGPYQDNFYGQEARTNSVFYEAKTTLDKSFYIDAGVRHDNHSIFGGKTTYKVAPAYLIDSSGTKLRGSVGTGFKAPSLVQLYSSYGNRDLQPEQNLGWDAGIDQDLVKDRVSVSLTYFDMDYDELITFNPSTFVLENIDKANMRGAEIGLTTRLSESLSTRLAYTYTDTENDTTGEALLRRPKNKNSLTVVYQPTSRFRSQVQWRVYSSRFDNDFNTYPPERVSLGGYGIVDLAASYQLSQRFELFARVDNLFDKEYQEVLGYGTLGAAAYGGIKVSL
jgi:vitamin B12 transporter